MHGVSRAMLLVALASTLAAAVGNPFPRAVGEEPIDVALRAPSSCLAIGQTMDVTVEATVTGEPLADAAVSMSATSGLSFLTPSSGTSDANGTFSATIRAAALGEQSIGATVSKDPYLPGSNSLIISVTGALSLSMNLRSDTWELMSYETATVRIALYDPCRGEGVTGAQFTIFSPAGGNVSGVAELGDGDYMFLWDAPWVEIQTYATIAVRASVDGYPGVSGLVTILVDPNKTGTNAQLFLVVQPETSWLGFGETINVTLFVYAIEGYVVRGAAVVVRMVVSIGTLGPVVDRLNGVYTFTYTAPSAGYECTSLALRIDASKDGYRTGTVRTGLAICP